jgi:hypothetical protein
VNLGGRGLYIVAERVINDAAVRKSARLIPAIKPAFRKFIYGEQSAMPAFTASWHSMMHGGGEDRLIPRSSPLMAPITGPGTPRGTLTR